MSSYGTIQECLAGNQPTANGIRERFHISDSGVFSYGNRIRKVTSWLRTDFTGRRSGQHASRRADAPIPDASSCLPLQRGGSAGPWLSNSVAEIGKAAPHTRARSSCQVSTMSATPESSHVTLVYNSHTYLHPQRMRGKLGQKYFTSPPGAAADESRSST